MSKDRIIMISCSVVCGSLFSINYITAQRSHPNIVMIMADDQGWGDLAINGNTTVRTPHIDRIAREGVSFDNFYVCPVSSPTRAEFLTGRYALRGGVRDVSRGGERLNLDEVTIAGYFKQAGYTTAAYGKWHSGTQYPYHPNARGFDEFYGFCSGHWGNYWNPMLEHNGEVVTGEGFIIDDLTSHAIEFIRENKDKPLFIYLPYNTPHSPMQVPDKWWDKMKDRPLLQSATLAQDEDTTFTKAALALTENIDWNVGRVMAEIEHLGLDEETIFIYITDNGPNGYRWNGGMRGRKGSVDEGGVRSPLFIRWNKNLPQNKTVQALSGVVDLLPTLLDLAGVQTSFTKELDGVSLKDCIFNTPKKWNRTLFSFWNNRLSVRKEGYLLNAEDQLYHTLSDRTQQQDLSSSNGKVKKELQEEKKRFEREVLSLRTPDERPFTIGYPGERFSKLPARDGTAHGGIERSNRYPNSSYFKNWKTTSDYITWPVEVGEAGLFEVSVYYTCSPEDVGSEIELAIGGNKVKARLTVANDSPMLGAELDRVPRMESYSKGFAPFVLGDIYLEKGQTTATLKATKIPAEEVMYFQMLVLKRKK